MRLNSRIHYPQLAECRMNLCKKMPWVRVIDDSEDVGAIGRSKKNYSLPLQIQPICCTLLSEMEMLLIIALTTRRRVVVELPD